MARDRSLQLQLMHAWHSIAGFSWASPRPCVATRGCQWPRTLGPIANTALLLLLLSPMGTPTTNTFDELAGARPPAVATVAGDGVLVPASWPSAVAKRVAAEATVVATVPNSFVVGSAIFDDGHGYIISAAAVSLQQSRCINMAQSVLKTDDGSGGPLPAAGVSTLPNVWGGSAFGDVGSVSGHLFAFSGADGPTRESSGFVGVLAPTLYDIFFTPTGATLHCGLGSTSHNSSDTASDASGVGKILAASSDALVVAPFAPTDAAPTVVVAYSSWDLLLGRAPEVALVPSSASAEPAKRGVAQSAFIACNLTGRWHVGGHNHWAEVSQGMVGAVHATAHGVPRGGWTEASGTLSDAGVLTLWFNNGHGEDHARLTVCSSVDWASRRRPGWSRMPSGSPGPPAPPPLPPAPGTRGCTTIGQLSLCKAGNGSHVFAVAFGADSAARAGAAVEETSIADVDATARARLTPVASLSAPQMGGDEMSRVAAKMYSIMRVNTLSPEGVTPTHWSTPDRTPHKAMWSWDSCFHAIGRSTQDPELTWEFIAAMLHAQGEDGHVPGGITPWSDPPSPPPSPSSAKASVNPPLLALATQFVHSNGGVNTSSLEWALPRLEAYIEWTTKNRQWHNSSLLLAWGSNGESGLDNSPLWEGGIFGHSPTVGLASTDLTSYVALEMSMLARMHTAVGNTTGSSQWSKRSKTLAAAIHEQLWDDVDGVFYYATFDPSAKGGRQFRRIMTPEVFAPLLLDGVPEAHVARLVAHLSNTTTFDTIVPLPTVAAEDHTYSTDMWRGPMWINTNWFTILGLRNYPQVPGALAAADKLQRAAVAAVARGYSEFGTSFEFYDSANVTPPTKLARKGKYCGGVRDYHWTAALTYWMLYNANGSLAQNRVARANKSRIHFKTDDGQLANNISKVFIVFSNHLDVGYTNSSAAGVVQKYWDEFFPAAIATAAEFRKRQPGPLGPSRQPTQRFRWMCHSWIVSMYRHCGTSSINVAGPGHPSALRCPSAVALATFEAAVRAGDIGWHAFPFNAEPEVYEQSLFKAALNLTFTEDTYFGHAKRITYSQRDVPGLTRAAIPLLVEAGVQGITVGENKDCAPVNVPPIFRWQDNATQSDIIALFHPHGYGRRRRRLHSQQEQSAKQARASIACCAKGLPKCCSTSIYYKDCVAVAAAGAALCYAWKQDNQGPHSYDEAHIVFTQAQKIFPGASVVASDAFDDFIRAVEPVKHTLPLLQAEIGDSWVHGSSADPVKVALFRAASRKRAACVKAGNCDPSSSSLGFKTFERLLLKVGEHTWGWAGGDTQKAPWTNVGLQMQLREDPSYAQAINSWEEQRSFVHNAVAALGGGQLSDDIYSEWAEMVPVHFDTTDFRVVNASAKYMCGPDVEISFDPATGGINTLLIGDDGHSWATSSRQLLRPWYQNVDAAYIKAFDVAYGGPRMGGNFGKPGLNLSAMNSSARVLTLQHRTCDTNTSFVVRMAMEEAAHSERGAPDMLEALVVVPHATPFQIQYTLQWFNKTSCHAPETLWLLNSPVVTASAGWVLDKLGSEINPLDANLSTAASMCPKSNTCGVHLHAVGDGGAAYRGREGTLRLQSLDSMLVSVGKPLPAPTPLTTPDPLGGMHFSLVNNLWNTNYPEFFPFNRADKSSRFRFLLTLGNNESVYD